MEKDSIERAKERAQLVVDGMAKVRDQQARDVIKLASHIFNQEQKILDLRKTILELSVKNASERFSSNPFGEGIFK